MIDCGFPIIKYELDQQPLEWGRQHGESFRGAIIELVEIRTQLMREKNAGLNSDLIESLAAEQWSASKKLAPSLVDELSGIAQGANVSHTDIVVLNNYTDFRDIQIDDQGCSLVYVNSEAGPAVGQTWDMHGSAKNYVCCLEIPHTDSSHRTILFSLVGCVGMMGFTTLGTVLGVNNINTNRARAGVMWPVLVRTVLQQTNLLSMTNKLVTADVTSGHNYLVADNQSAQMWEVAPELSECVSELTESQHGHLLHTNHCIGKKVIERETSISQNSTTHTRFELLNKKIRDTKSIENVFDLMNDHENYPKSICSNFQTDAQDPSITCGGAVGHLQTGEVQMWRGDQMYDENFVLHTFDMSENR